MMPFALMTVPNIGTDKEPPVIRYVRASAPARLRYRASSAPPTVTDAV